MFLSMFLKINYFSQLEKQPPINSKYFSEIFYHRNIMVKPQFNKNNIVNILKRYLNPSVSNEIFTDDHILRKIQSVYPMDFSNHRTRYTRKIVENLTEESHQEGKIIQEQNRPHDNRAQLLEQYYFPQINVKIKKIVKQYKICQENKYERHLNVPIHHATPILHYLGRIIHIDIYHTNNKIVLTAIDKFSKYAQAKLANSRAVEDIMQELIISFGIPKKVVIDKEKSLNSAPITFMMENQYGIEIFRTPPYTSTTNGQINVSISPS